MTQDAKTLLPCPFCGSTFVAQGASNDRISVWCGRCGSRGPDAKFPEDCMPGPPIDECRAAWNRRPLRDGEATEGTQASEPFGAEALIRWAHDTLYEINPADYNDAEVRKINDASVEVILGLAQFLGEKHGKTEAWWAEYRSKHPVPSATPPVAQTGTVGANELINRLQDAIEGECDGLAVDEDQAQAILEHVGYPAAPAMVGRPWRDIPVDDDTLDYVSKYGGRCRDCADVFGICPSGLPCEPNSKRAAIRHVLRAINYGMSHGFLSAPTVEGVGL